uniref:Uncharacterized protein n=1 Tax=Eutreptiella gymnastica TaxID=73025 RepID=A0A7S4FQI3_9EUGL
MQISTAAAVNAQKHDRRHESQPIPKEMGPLFQKTHHYTVVQRINEHGQYHDPTPVPKIKGILLGCHATAPPPLHEGIPSQGKRASIVLYARAGPTRETHVQHCGDADNRTPLWLWKPPLLWSEELNSWMTKSLPGGD